MKVKAFRIRDFKKISIVDATIDHLGSVVQVTGPNGAGKSSVIDGIIATIGGEKLSPTHPIRRGSNSASASITLGEYEVTRTWKTEERDGDVEILSTLTVRGADGRTISRRPQQILNELVGKLSFDPVAFYAMDAKQQAEQFRAVTGLDFTELDKRRKDIFEKRTDVNKLLKAAEARRDAIAFDPNVASERVSTLKLIELINNAKDRNRDNANQRERLRTLRADYDTAKKEVERLEYELANARKKFAQIEADGRSQNTICKALEEQSTDLLEAQLSNAETINAAIDAQTSRRTIDEECKRYEKEAANFSEIIAKIDGEKNFKLATANLPIPDLGISGEGVNYKGVPLDQASQVERLRVSLAMAAALNPQLRTLFVRDTPMITKASLAIITTWAETNDYQIIMERAIDDPATDGVGLVIEEGSLVSIRDNDGNLASLYPSLDASSKTPKKRTSVRMGDPSPPVVPATPAPTTTQPDVDPFDDTSSPIMTPEAPQARPASIVISSRISQHNGPRGRSRSGDIYYEMITSEMPDIDLAGEEQQKLGYHPAGYGFHSFACNKRLDGTFIATWKSSDNCE
jgi:hypothetical protein